MAVETRSHKIPQENFKKLFTKESFHIYKKKIKEALRKHAKDSTDSTVPIASVKATDFDSREDQIVKIKWSMYV